jgi:hypothetical protein
MVEPATQGATQARRALHWNSRGRADEGRSLRIDELQPSRRLLTPNRQCRSAERHQRLIATKFDEAIQSALACEGCISQALAERSRA